MRLIRIGRVCFSLISKKSRGEIFGVGELGVEKLRLGIVGEDFFDYLCSQRNKPPARGRELITKF